MLVRRSRRPVWSSESRRRASAERMNDRARFCPTLLVLVSIVLSACGTLPAQVDRPFSLALQSSADSPLVRIAQNSSPAPTLTGFRLLPEGFYWLDAGSSLPAEPATRSTSSIT